MNIVKLDAEILFITPNALQEIERAGRVAYKSEDRITEDSADSFIRMLLKRKHYAVLEFADATIKFVMDRGLTHELVRHRLNSFVQESTRFCNYFKDKFGKELTVIQPPFSNPDSLKIWYNYIDLTEHFYLKMIELGEKPEIARSILPQSLKAEIVMKANFRQWLHILNLRYYGKSGNPHPQMKEVMTIARSLLVERYPTIFGQEIDVD